MPGPIEDRLSQFTPAFGDLDRDALLFAAGRASARPDRKWPALAALLALSQALTLALLWVGITAPRRVEPAPAAPLVPSESMPTVPLVSRDWRSAFDERPVAESTIDDLVPDEPPLRASAARGELSTY